MFSPRSLAIASALVAALLPQALFGAGARNLPFTTYEAEAATTSGGATKKFLTTIPTPPSSSPEYEASGRAFAILNSNSEAIHWDSVRSANKMIVRFSVPDGSSGGGASFTLSVYSRTSPSTSTWTNRGNITLNSKYAWLYGSGDNPQGNTPGSGAHVFWDDARFTIPGGTLTAGHSIKLQKDSDDTASYYHIDLIDLETSAAAPSTPASGTYLDVTASPYNAVPNDGNDDRAAIQACIDAAAAANPKKIVWVPTGVFNLSSALVVKGVEVRGRNYWNTRFIVAGNVRGFNLINSGGKLTHVLVSNETTTNRSTTDYAIHASFGNTSNWLVENCWVQHTGAAMWMANAQGGTASKNRVYNTYADGINVNRGGSGNTIIDNYVRGTGDDGIALLSELKTNNVTNPISTNNTVKFNTSVAQWWGANFALRGGSGHVIEDNYFADSTAQPSVAINLESAAGIPKYAITGAIFRRNDIRRGGGNHGSQKRGAIWIHPSNNPITGLQFFDTTITSPLFRGVHFHSGTNLVGATFTNTTITSPGEDAVIASGTANGGATFTNGSITGLNSGYVKFNDMPGNTFTFTTSGI